MSLIGVLEFGGTYTFLTLQAHKTAVAVTEYKSDTMSETEKRHDASTTLRVLEKTITTT